MLWGAILGCVLAAAAADTTAVLTMDASELGAALAEAGSGVDNGDFALACCTRLLALDADQRDGFVVAAAASGRTAVKSLLQAITLHDRPALTAAGLAALHALSANRRGSTSALA